MCRVLCSSTLPEVGHDHEELGMPYGSDVRTEKIENARIEQHSSAASAAKLL